MRGTPRLAHLVDLLRHRAAAQPEATAYEYLPEDEGAPRALPFGQLDEWARAIAASLQSRTAPGDRALLLFPPGLDFIPAFFGCLYAGLVAVPAYPPRQNHLSQRLQSLVRDCQASAVLTVAGLLDKLAERSRTAEPALAGLEWLAVDALPGGLEAAGDWRTPDLSGETLAFLQYTSGSTGTPKGVEVSHANLLHNEAMIAAAFGHSERTLVVGWLPLFHDMGLIGNVLQPLYLGRPCVLLSPVAVLQRPVRWLRAISRYRATTSGAPDFAYNLCVERISEEERAGLDLSSWEVAYNGAEPVRAETLERFAAAFAPCGFRREAFYPCYGLAEATLLVSGGRPELPPAVESVDAAALERHEVRPAGEGPSRRLVSCGHAHLGQEIRIVDPEALAPCPPGRIGEIWVSGPSVAGGYWNRPEESAATFQARLPDDPGRAYLRTGDLGYLAGGDLFVTGRRKDLIVIRGRNHYPQDVERTAGESHPALRPGFGAAFGVEVDGEERLVVVHEVERTRLRGLDAGEVIAALRRRIAEEHDLQLHAAVLLKTGGLPRTSSGKVQRRACRDAFLAGELPLAAPGADWRREAAAPPVSAAVPPAAGKAASAATAAIRAWLAERIAARSGLPLGEIDGASPFSSFGLDSRAAITLSGELESWLGRPLPPTLLYDHPTLDLLARHLAGEEDGQPAAPVLAPVPLAPDDAIAVIGLGCRFPGAGSPEAFWRLLRDGVDAVGPASPRRRSDGAAAAGERGGFLAEVDGFDYGFFGIPLPEAERMDPQQRLLLEVAWEALEDAGLAAGRLAGSDTGVFVGISTNDYGRLAGGPPDAYDGTGNAFSIAANRLSYFLDLRGPSWAVDTACSSSLVAVHQACQSLRQGECGLALAGGVNLILAPHWSEAFARAGMMSADGRCKTFDARADGYVRGEGCGVVVLKRLADARRDGDPVLALVRGSAVNQDGRSNGLTAPNGQAQRAVIRRALGQAGVEPASLGYVEAHGTGTPLGDPIEMAALQEVLGEGREGRPCRVGSVKTNLGHLEAAAGIAGLIKAVLALAHREIPPHLHLAEPNPAIRLDGTPFEVPRALAPWESEGVRRAGVSAFGFGGTNAHVVLEEAPSEEAPPVQEIGDPPVLVLSARSDAALRRLAGDWAAHLAARPDLDLGDVCFTAVVGRVRFPHSLTARPATAADLASQLAAFAEGRDAPGVTREPGPGAWTGLPRRRVRLPTYPFERRRCWLEAAPAEGERGWLYEVAWSPAPAAPAAVLPAGGRWLLVADRGGVAEALAARLRERGQVALLVAPGDPWPEETFAGVVHLGSLDGDVEGSLGENAAWADVLRALGSWERRPAAERPRLWLVTSGALAGATLWGFGRVLAEEHPELWGGLIELDDAGLNDVAAARLLDEIGSTEPAVAWREGRRLVPHLARCAAPPPEQPGPAIGPEGSYLITGGLGALGLEAAGWLVDSGAHHLVLAGRRAEPGPEARAALQALRARGVKVRTAAVDLADRPALAALLESLREGPAPLRGVIHAAGVLDDGALLLQSPERFQRVLAPKALGAWNLHLLTRDLPLDLFVCFSSAAGLLGSPGQGSYAAASSFLDGLARDRRALGLPGVSLDWGPWTVGMAAGRSFRAPIRPIPPAAGRRALGEALRHGGAQIAVLPVEDWSGFAVDRPEPALLADLVRHARRRGRPAAALPIPTADRLDRLEEWVRAETAGILGIRLAEVEPDRPLLALGFDSMSAIELRNRCRRDLGVDLPLASLLDGGTPAGIAAALAGRLSAGTAVSPEPGPGSSTAITGPQPVSPGQRALWLLHQLDPGSAAYNLAVAVRLERRLPEAEWRRALAALVERHPVLSLAYRTGPTGLQAYRIDGEALPFEIASAWDEGAADRPFDLESGPVWRAVLTEGANEDRLLWAVHHIAADFASLEVLLRDLDLLLAGGAPPPLSGRHGDWVLEQEESLAGPEGERLWAYWRERLAGELPVLDLPADRPRPPLQTFRGGAVPFALAGDAARRLRGLAARTGATPFVVFLAALQALLARWTGQTDVMVGSPLDGRPAGFEGVVGYFVNPVVLRGDLSGDPTFAAVLAAARGTALEAIEHRSFPFPLLVERLKPARDPARSPLFQVELAWDRLRRAPESAGAGALGATVLAGQRGAAFDLTLTVLDSGGLGDRFDCAWRHNADLFDPPTAARLGRALEILLAAAAAEPERPLGQLPLLAEEEVHQLTREWNDTVVNPGEAGAIGAHRLFEAQARRRPQAVALVAGDTALTYAELDHRAGRVASALRALGAGPESIVGFCTDRSADLVIGLLGVLKAGGAYLPLDPEHPPERLSYLIEDSGASLIVTQRALLSRLPAGPPVFCLDDLPPGEGADETSIAVPPEGLAYVLYTSGSTGRPKGVQVSHGAFTAFLHAMARRPGAGPEDVLLAVTTLGFDIAGLEIFLPLATGGRVVLAERRDTTDGARLAALLQSSGATVMQATPATWSLLLGAGGWRPGLRVLCGGEALTAELAASLLRQGGEVWNLYGPTEATVWLTVQELREPPASAVAPIGRPIAGSRALVLDPEMRPVPLGAAGELFLGGAGLARGYLGRPALTAERFMPDPWAADPGERLYRTGDRARHLPDGTLEYLGRLDRQIKVRGVRIEPGEIETALLQHPGVAEAAVVARGTGLDAVLAAAWVAAPGGTAPEGASLRAFLEERLPAPLVPAMLVRLESLPLTPNGKVDRDALARSPALLPAAGAAAPLPPATAAERAVAAVWRELLRLDESAEIGVHDSFFELGGHSLALARARDLLQERFGRPVSMVEMFRFPTIHALARHLGAPSGASDDTAPIPFPRPAGRAAIRQERRLDAVRQRAIRQGLRLEER